MKKVLCICLAGLLLLGCAGCGQRQPVDIRSAITLQDLSGAHIAAQEYTYHAEAAKQIKDAKVTTYATFADMEKALAAGDIDGFVAEEPTAKALCQRDEARMYVPLINNTTGFTVETEAVSTAAALPAGSALLGQINTVLATITAADKQLLMNQMVALAAGEDVETPFGLTLTEVIPEDAPVLRVGMECAYEPFNWAEKAQRKGHGQPIVSGELKGQYAFGYDVEVARYVANKLGMRLEIHAMPWSTLPDALLGEEVDVLIAGMSPVEFPDAGLEFTGTYYESHLVVVTKK